MISAVSTVVEVESSRSLEEMLFDTTTAALAAAGLTVSDLDSIVLGGNDQTDGRVISIMAGAGPTGGVHRDTTMIASSADHALVYGYLRLKAGQGTKVMVVGWAKPSESVDPDRAELMSAEPYLLRQVGMNNTIAAALQASRWVSSGDETPTDAQPVAWPLARTDLPGRGDTVHAVILAAEDDFPQGTELAWVVDAGWATTTYEIGARDLADLGALRAALGQIMKRTPSASPESWTDVEIGADSEPAVRAVVRSLPLQAGVAVNASGTIHDVLTSPFVSGMGRMTAAIRNVGAVGTLERPRISAGIGFNGFAGQGATVMVFSSSKGDAA